MSGIRMVLAALTAVLLGACAGPDAGSGAAQDRGTTPDRIERNQGTY